MNPILILTMTLAIMLLGPGCSQDQKPLIVYAGKGLIHPVEEIKKEFEQREGIPVSVVYAGSNTLLNSIKTTQRGDIFIPGSSSYIKDAGQLIVSHAYIAQHVPAFATKPSNNKQLKDYHDLLKPGVHIAVCNKDMAALGRINDAILKNLPPEESYQKNIYVTGSTVNEVLQLLINEEVDAAMVWTDMLKWEQSRDLQLVKIPAHLNKTKEIMAAVLSTSENPEQSRRFLEFASSRGREIFVEHGFGQK